MLLGRPVSGEFGFSLNPLHYVKKAAVGIYHVDKAIVKNKFVQKAAVTAANAYAPGSGTLVQTGLQTVSPSGGGTVATPAGQSPAAPQAPAVPDTSQDTDAPAAHGGGDKLFGLPKKYVLIGGGVLGVVLLLKVLR